MQDAAAATHKLAHYFEEVDTVMEYLERQLFAAAEDFLRLGCNEPAVLVRMVQVCVLPGLEAWRLSVGARQSFAHRSKLPCRDTTKRWVDGPAEGKRAEAEGGTESAKECM